MDLIAAKSLVFLPKIGFKSLIFGSVTWIFHGRPRKTIGHLFYTKTSFVHHFKSISELKMELQCKNAQFGSKLAIVFVLCGFKIWCMTLKNNRAPLLCHYKLCASFHSHPWTNSLETPNLIQNRWFFLPEWPWNLTDDREKQKGTLSMPLQALVIIS